MTEEQIKEMLKDIIDNNAEYEYTYMDYNGNYAPYTKYHLGEEIHPTYEFRKVKKFRVVFNKLDEKYCILPSDVFPDTVSSFEGTKEECEEWIHKNTKTWIDELVDAKLKDETYTHTYYGIKCFEKKDVDWKIRSSIEKVCKKIHEEANKRSVSREAEGDYYEDFVSIENLKNIIKELGVENV